MADRIIPLNPGPNAMPGPDFKIEVARPRDKKALNTDEIFKHVRTEALNYLVELGDVSKLTNTQDYVLPDLEPVLPSKRLFPFLKKAS